MDEGCYGIKCHGEVEMRYSAMSTPNPRCQAHTARRFGHVERHIRELATPPSDFDESYCGEHWSEE
jgi:hypothetical protein